MNGAKCAACLAAVLFVLFAFVVKGAKSIICYKCNSKYDPRCGDPFNPYTIGLVDCNITDVPSHLKGKEPVICRKTVQNIHKSIRIVRDCGYVEDPAHDDQDCYGRLGSHDIDVTHCSCTSDMCNGSKDVVSNGPYWYSATATAMAATAAVTIMGFFLNIHHL
ncbi:protein quiver-like [Metopolophium dirhodum]|uniref:protein quiver-like n=1 Tax=Metopolophium dirhodum TaxID=44670 RepID=UPI00298FDB23|nr:protein quiver-like [Metopolophium dirhodum]